MILVDSCVLLDVLHGSEHWKASLRTLEKLSAKHELCINEIIYTEIAPSFNKEKKLQSFLEDVGISLERCPWESLYTAGLLWKEYRDRGGPRRRRILPDFIIAAHVLGGAEALVTRDSYFDAFDGLRTVSPS